MESSLTYSWSTTGLPQNAPAPSLPGQGDEAVRESRRVEDRFADAELSIAYFLHKDISLPECTAIQPGTAAEVKGIGGGMGGAGAGGLY